LEKPGALDARKLSNIKIGELITRYVKEVDAIKPLGRSKRFSLDKLGDSSLANLPAKDLEAKHIIDYCRSRKLEGAGPSTVILDIAYFRSVLSMAEPAWGLPIGTSSIDLAKPTLKKLNLIGKSAKRDRRPTPEELEILTEHFLKRDAQDNSSIQMTDILNFAIYSAMRKGEICGIRWDDLDHEKKTVVIRERKDPTNKQNNDQVVPLLGDAWGIATRQTRVSDCIFPYNSKSVGAAFTAACRELKIIDLRFHDLRHEGASRLFEQGYSIEQVALVTGHKDWNMLRRYTQLKPESLHRN